MGLSIPEAFLVRADEVVERRNDFRIRHKTDIPKYLGDVRYWVNSGKHMLALRFSGFDLRIVGRSNGRLDAA